MYLVLLFYCTYLYVLSWRDSNARMLGNVKSFTIRKILWFKMTVSLTYRQMFWTDWGKNAKIEMSDMDGKNRKILVGENLVWPNGLAIDINKPKQSRNLYYTDAFKDIIGQYDLINNKNKV